MRLIIMGPPGAGKGTQATAISEEFSIPAISTGDIFRANVSEGTELGREAQRYMDAGDYVPDEVTNRMVNDRLGQPDCQDGFLLDGYPRTTAQVSELDQMLADRHVRLDAALLLEVDDEELVQRLLQRAATEGRPDDTEDVVRRRHEVYRAETAPLVEVYRERGLLVTVDGMGEVAAVTSRVLAALRDVAAAGA